MKWYLHRRYFILIFKNKPMTPTPAMQQYYDIKKEYSDTIVFFRMWDFYEMFWEDAHIAHKVLWITITTRNKNAKDPEALAWFPYHAKDKYLPMLVNAWYKVAIVEQVSDPKLKWIVKREVVRVVTPSTLSLESDIYDDFANNSVIISIFEEKEKFGLSFLDITTNKWQTWEFFDFKNLSKELYKLNPKEVILEKKLFSNIKIKEILEKKFSLNIYYFENNWNAKEKLLNHFQTKDLSWFWIEWKNLAISASALLLNYLELNQKKSLKNLYSISNLALWEYLELDESTIKNLDIIYNFSTWSYNIWTLFWVLDKTKTSMWKRLLRENILKPLKNISVIQERLDFVEEFLRDKVLLSKVREKLSYISDIDAILNRLSLERVTPRDLLNLKKSLESVLEIIEIIKKDWSEKLKKIISI